MAANIFVDESGNLEITGDLDSEPYYVIACIYSSSHSAEVINARCTEIVVRHARDGELKSSSIGRNLSRRKQILREIAGCDFGIYVLVVDKRMIAESSGLRYRRSSYKFYHSLFFTYLESNLNVLNVLADQYGRSEFMESFKDYIDKRMQFFSTFSFQPSSEVPELQIADVISGSVRRAYKGDDSFEALTELGYPAIPIQHWPPTRVVDEVSAEAPGSESDLVRRLAVEKARSFILNYAESSEDDRKLQVRSLRYLLHEYYVDPSRFFSRAEIARSISPGTGRVSDDYMSRNVISKLRTEGVLLVSTDAGLKIPYSMDDIRQWLTRVSTQVVPYLSRVELARQSILVRSENRIDILSDEHSELRRFINRNSRV